MTETLTDQDRETLRKGVTGAGLLVALSDRSFFDTFKEAGALAQHLAKARQSSSALVREIAQGAGTGFGLTASPDEVGRETLESLRSAVAILESKSPQDADAYRDLVLDVAQSVSAAAGGGESAESAAVEQIRGAVGR